MSYLRTAEKQLILKQLLITCTLLLAACGQTGELRLPEEPKPVEQNPGEAAQNSQ